MATTSGPSTPLRRSASPTTARRRTRSTQARSTRFVGAFGAAAARLKQGGFDGCEVMASACHLVDQFWTPRANRRTDEYGGELAGRLRFAVEILRSIHERVGTDFIVGIRMSGDEMLPDGLGRTACQEIAGRLDALGLLDYFNVVGATCETYATEAATVPDMSFPLAPYAPLAAAIKAVVRVPPIATGRINDPALAERVLREGHADLCVMTRALIADPELPAKARSGRLDDIRPCVGYNSGCIDRIYTGKGVSCVQNAVAGRELEWSELPMAVRPLAVVIVGGGPAGLECARVARLRGHRVVLFEQSRDLGGQTLLARQAPGRQDFDGACRYTAAQCRKLGVDIRPGVRGDAETVLRESPDVAVLATGARALAPDLPGFAHHAVSAWDVLAGSGGPEGAGDRRGVRSPGALGRRISARPRVRGGDRHLRADHRRFLGATTAPPVFERLFTKGVRLHCHLQIVGLEPARAVAMNVWSRREEALGPFDAFVYAYGGESVCGLERELAGRVGRLELIGDCFAPRTLQHAILDGHRLARML